jgi:type I restriction enzyme S subunit
MRNEWQDKKLGDVCRLLNGRAYSKHELLEAGKYRVLRVGNFFTSNNWYYSNMELPEDKYCDTGDLLYAWSASFGPRIWTGEKVIFHYHIWKVQADPALVEKEFLFLWLLWDTDLIKKDQGAGTTMIHVAKGSMEDRKISLPSLPEQRRIVRLLNEAFAGLAVAKANSEKNLQNARAIFESELRSILMNKKWVWKLLGDLCTRVEYGSAAKSKRVGRVPVLRMGNIQGGRFDWSNLVYSVDEAEIKKYNLNMNDVLFNRTNSPALVGKSAIYKGEAEAIFAGYLIRIHLKEDMLNADYLNYFLNSEFAMDHGKSVAISSVNQANISGEKLKRYPIPVPALSDQRAIAKRLELIASDVQRLEGIYEQKLTALDNLKKSLLHQAFTGQLTAA